MIGARLMEECPAHSRFFTWWAGNGRFGWVEEEMGGCMRQLGVDKQTGE